MASGSIWIDITEFFDQFRAASHPTGISRTALNLADALADDPGEVFAYVRPLFWHPLLHCALTTEEPRLSPLGLFFPQLSRFYSAAGLTRLAYSSRKMKALATSLPRPLRYRLFPADNGVVLFCNWAKEERIRLVSVDFTAADSLFFPGSFWLGRYMPRLIRQARAAGCSVTAFVHDALLLSNPEWLPGRHSLQFGRGCEAVLPRCAAIVCNSRHTAAELRRLVRLPDDLPIRTCRLADRAFTSQSTDVPPEISEMLGRRYVLFVSTLIPRKNHKLLVQVWDVLWEQLGVATPYLLFVGGGAPDGPLASMMEQQRTRTGRVIWLGGLNDCSLELLYRHAWLAAYPSLAEGYGLPVAEALSRGKVCLAAPNGGIREISDELIDFIDPHDARSVANQIISYLVNPGRLAAREREIIDRYRPTGWPEVAGSIRSILEETVRRPGKVA
jgi:glycosyltransferase involved in cell wall biosynthesis